MKTIINKIKILAFGFLFSMLAVNNISIAQDTLHFRNGKLIIGTVTEITSVVVKYKKIDHVDGPIYSDLKNDIASINYKNGTNEKFEYQMPVQTITKPKETFVLVTKTYPELKRFGSKFLYGNELVGNREMHSILLGVNDPKISKHIRLAKKQAAWQYIGFGFFPCAIAALSIASETTGDPTANSTYFNDEMAGAAIMGVLGVACFATSITLKAKRNKNEAAALKLYQQNY